MRTHMVSCRTKPSHTSSDNERFFIIAAIYSGCFFFFSCSLSRCPGALMLLLLLLEVQLYFFSPEMRYDAIVAIHRILPFSALKSKRNNIVLISRDLLHTDGMAQIIGTPNIRKHKNEMKIEPDLLIYIYFVNGF